MSEKNDLQNAPSVQNLVVYVSSDGYRQEYGSSPQNVQENRHSDVQNGNYTNQPHSLATMVDCTASKQYLDKSNAIKTDYPNSRQLVNGCIATEQPHTQGNYFSGIATQNNFTQPIVNSVNLNYENGASIINEVKSYGVIAGETQAGPERQGVSIKVQECESIDTSGYVTVMGAEGHSQSVRCESVRSETAESSCSSLSSVEEGVMTIVHNQSSEMVVYDSAINVRPSGVVLTVGSPAISLHPSGTSTVVGPVNNVHLMPITVPYGWKRLLNNGTVIYISPSNAALDSPDQVKEYLMSPGTCKCGLECPFKYEKVFNFDPKVPSKPWILSPDTTTGDLTKLCNHKRKIFAVDAKILDPNVRYQKDYRNKSKKKKLSSYCSGISISDMLTQAEKVTANQHHLKKETEIIHEPMWSDSVNHMQVSSSRTQSFSENNQSHQIVKFHNQDPSTSRILVDSSSVSTETIMAPSLNLQHISEQNIPISSSNSNVHIDQQHIIGPNEHLLSVQGPIIPAQVQQQDQLLTNQNVQSTNSNIIIQAGQVPSQSQEHRVFINEQPDEPSGPGRPVNFQMMPFNLNNLQKPDLSHKQLYNNHFQHYGPNYVRPFTQNNHLANGYRPQNNLVRMQMSTSQQQAKVPWQNRIQNHVQFNVQENQVSSPIQSINNHLSSNVYERVPPLHLQQNSTSIWQDELKRKKKHGKNEKKRPYNFMDCNIPHSPCPNIDVRQIPTEGSRAVIINQFSQSASSPSFMEDPSGYLAQQTALLNNTINRQTGVCTQFTNNNPNSSISNHHSHLQFVSDNETINSQMHLPSNSMIKQHHHNNSRTNQNVNIVKSVVPHDVISRQCNQIMIQSAADSSILNEHCQNCLPDSNQMTISDHVKVTQSNTGPDNKPCTPNSSDDPVTSSTYSEKHINHASPDSRPIQGGTISTSNVSPVEGSHSDSPTPCSNAIQSYQHLEALQTTTNNNNSNIPFTMFSQTYQNHLVSQSQPHFSNSREISSLNSPDLLVNKVSENHYNLPQLTGSSAQKISSATYAGGIVTTMASGRTVGSNTITSVLAGRASTATVSINNPANIPSTSTIVNTGLNSITRSQTTNISKSPLEMVQSVVSSIQIPHSQQNNVLTSTTSSNSHLQQHIVKHSPTGLPGHILVSSCGQILMANSASNNQTVMPPPPPKIMNNQGMPPISVSPLVTNVTAAVSQVIPAVAQQVLGQQTVLVNTLPTPFVLQPGVAMAVDGMTVSQNVPLPQIVTGNMLQQPIQIDNSDPRRPTLLSPETKKKGKKRKVPSSPTVASMLQVAAQQNQGLVMSPQGFPQHVQMTHSPQGITAGQVMQALTIVPSKNGGAHQLVMNSQPMSNTGHISTQQLIANSQPTQQINLLQPVNLINSATGVVQNFPTIQQFIVPNLGGMVMNPDGTATILQDTSNLGMQLQIQTLNGQNVLTPVQNNSVFNGNQNILAAGPAGMVIRAPSTQSKIIHQQQHSPGAQFLSPNGGQFVVNGTQFGGQLSPLVASVSPSQQVAFNTSPQQQMRSANSTMHQSQQEYIQCGQIGQTLMVPCTPTGNIAVTSSNQNATFVQQNTTIVQQHTTMVSNNQQVHNFPSNTQHSHANLTRSGAINVDPTILISTSDNSAKPMQLQVNASSYRQSVSTQTAVNQNAQAVTTNTFCQTSTSSGSSPPDTTTHSPLAIGVESPLAADTTTHTGSTDDGLSPAPSNCSVNCDGTVQGKSQQQSCTMPMVHCISSSEPDLPEISSQESDTEWSRQPPACMTTKSEYSDVTSATHLHFSKKCTAPTNAESSSITNLQFLTAEQIKPQEATISSHTFEKLQKKKYNSSPTVVESKRLHSSFFEDDEEVIN